MLTKTHVELDKFVSNIKTIKHNEELLNYINSNLYTSVKLLIAISSTFAIFWRVILPFIVSLSILLVLFFIEPIGEELRRVLNMNYILIIFLCLVFSKLAYILHCKKYFIYALIKSKNLIEKDLEKNT